MEPTYKRKRSPQDSTVDLTRTDKALEYFESLKEELNGIEGREERMRILTKLHRELEDIRSEKIHRVSLSNVSWEELEKAGVERKDLFFVPEKLSELANELTTEARAEIADLYLRIKKIYERVNIYVNSGSCIILDEILLSLAEIYSTRHKNVAILPEMKVGPFSGVQISHHVSGHDWWLSDIGNVDYAIIEYEDVKAHKDNLLWGSTFDAFKISKGCLLIVQAKFYHGTKETLDSYSPEAVSLAIALLKSENLPEVRFCISNGQYWNFFILKLEDGKLISRESTVYKLSKEALEHSDLPLREIMLLICEWLNPTMADLCELEY